jgi:hypothetical protein
VLLHPRFDGLLGVANVFLAGNRTFGAIDYYLRSAFTAVNADSAFPAVAMSSHEVKGPHVFGDFAVEVSLEDLS